MKFVCPRPLLGALLTAAFCGGASAQLRITQYYEGGGSTNNWLELKNIGGSNINLADYTLGLWMNASTEGYKTNVAPTRTQALSGTLAPGAVYLIKHSSATVPGYPTANLSLGTGTVMADWGNDSLGLYTGTTFATANLVDAIGFVSSANDGQDISFGRLTTAPGWNTTAGSKANTFTTVWGRWPTSWVDSAVAGDNRRLGIATPTVVGPPVPPIPGSWTLTFQDEFDGSALDGNKWRLGQHWSGMAGSGGIDPANISVSSGKLRLESDQRTTPYGGTNYSYATGEVSTFRQFRQAYGYFEARVKNPAVTGLWPAFWLMPDRGSYGWKDAYAKSYLKFDLTGVSPGTISTATLSVRASAIEAGGTNNVVFMKLLDDSWSESTITWNNAPVPDPKWITQKWNNVITPGTDITIDVKDFVTQQMAGDKKISFVLADTFMRTKYLKFHSSEAVNTADRPRLVINGTTYYATEDAYVKWGTLAANNYGGATELWVEEEWGDTATTYSGGMEVDIMETLGIWGPNETSHAMHWDGYGADHQVTGFHDITVPNSADGFHTYGVYWEAGKLAYYVDGYKTGEWVNSRVPTVAAFMILSLQTGGWDNNNPGAQVNNQVMEVDYVRAWSGTRGGEPAASIATVDNAAGTGVTMTGAWTASTATPGYFGTNYHNDGNVDKGTKSFRFSPALTASGNYAVFARWPAGTNRATNVPIDILKADGTTSTVTVDQTLNNNKWIQLGVFPLSTSNAAVTIRTTGTNGFVMADAIRVFPQ
jgi:beta-glucanase (GH16 family)